MECIGIFQKHENVDLIMMCKHKLDTYNTTGVENYQLPLNDSKTHVVRLHSDISFT